MYSQLDTYDGFVIKTCAPLVDGDFTGLPQIALEEAKARYREPIRRTVERPWTH